MVADPRTKTLNAQRRLGIGKQDAVRQAGPNMTRVIRRFALRAARGVLTCCPTFLARISAPVGRLS